MDKDFGDVRFSGGRRGKRSGVNLSGKRTKFASSHDVCIRLWRYARVIKVIIHWIMTFLFARGIEALKKIWAFSKEKGSGVLKRKENSERVKSLREPEALKKIPVFSKERT